MLLRRLLKYECQIIPGLILVLFTSIPDLCQSQTTIPGNFTPNVAVEFLGWDASVNTDVLIYHLTPGQPRIFGTNNTERMRISGDVNQSLLINVQNSSFSKVRVFQDRGFGAVNARIDNYQQETSMVRGLICTINAPYTGPINIDEIGIHAFVDGNSSDYDVALRVQARGARNNFGVFGTNAGMGIPNLPNPPVQGNWAGVFTANVVGSPGSVWQSSDSTLKKNIELITDAREKLNQLRPVSFNFIEHDYLRFSDQLQFGFIAQEVAEVFPNLVKSVIAPASSVSEGSVEKLEHFTLNQLELIPVLVKGIQEQGEILSDNQSRINELQNILETNFLSTNPNIADDENE